ncbi:hypothetical protein BJY04DRAFT_223834, partial [Aspergillus karnatakaensis]|uniref:uncharacterized protein n=1 Tax=Aspergillus karnatakaensis TaxID=1810916 RepID=UPI003CCD5F1B
AGGPGCEDGGNNGGDEDDGDGGDDGGDDDDGDNEDKHEICRLNGMSIENWEKWKIDQALTTLATSVEPIDPNIHEELLRLYDQDEVDIAAFGCDPPRQCDLKGEIPEFCASNPELTFIFWAIQNFNNFCLDLAQAVVNSGTVADAKAALLVNTFGPEFENSAMSAGFSLANGLLTVLSGFSRMSWAAVPAGFAGIGGAIIGFASTSISEPAFDLFGEVTANIADEIQKVANALQEFPVEILEKTPDDRLPYKFLSDGIVQMFQDGGFAEPIDVPVVPDTTVASLTSSIINDLWLQQKIFVAKTTKDQSGIDSCDSPAPKEWTRNAWCDGDDIYMVLLWDQSYVPGDPGSSPSQMLAVPGIGDLEDFNLNKEKVIRSAYDWQRSQGAFHVARTMSRSISYLQDVWEDEIEDYKLLNFNLPVCNLENVGKDWPSTSDPPYGIQCTVGHSVKWCMIAYFAMWHCDDMYFGETESAWPWKNGQGWDQID